MRNRGTKGKWIAGAFEMAGGNPLTGKVRNSIARTDTSAKVLGVLPAGAIPIGVRIWTDVLSNAGTTANVSVGKSGTNTFFVNAFDVKGGTARAQNYPTTTNLESVVSATADTQVVGIYAETGGASNTGGPFWVEVEFLIP